MPTKRIVIVGAGGFGREVHTWVHQMAATHSQWQIAGFLDANRHALESFDIREPILGDPREYLPQDDELFVLAIGDPNVKLELAETLATRGAEFLTLVHPTAVVGSRCRLGRGVVICPMAVVTSDAVVDDFATLHLAATVSHDAHVGAGCTLCCHTDVTGGAHLERGVFLGSHASVLPRVRVGQNAVIGAGSVVVHPIAAGKTVVGAPAREIVRKLKKSA